MQATGRLEASRLLYEGSDLSEWLDSLRDILIQQFPGLKFFPTPSLRLWRVPSTVRNSDVRDCIWWQVSPYVRSRVSEENRGTAKRLLRTLCATARPFRFLDLPAEIRLIVYRLCPAPSTFHRILLLSNTQTGSPRSLKYTDNHDVEPPILSVNRQIRIEALPVIHQVRTISLVFVSRIRTPSDLRSLQAGKGLCSRPTNAERVQAINEWASRLVPDSTRLLREIHVQLPLLAICSKPNEDMLRFSLSPVNGKLVLSVEQHPWLKPSSQLLMSDHTAAISKVAQSLKLEGEALIMVLTSRPDIWDQLELADA